MYEINTTPLRRGLARLQCSRCCSGCCHHHPPRCGAVVPSVPVVRSTVIVVLVIIVVQCPLLRVVVSRRRLPVHHLVFRRLHPVNAIVACNFPLELLRAGMMTGVCHLRLITTCRHRRRASCTVPGVKRADFLYTWEDEGQKKEMVKTKFGENDHNFKVIAAASGACRATIPTTHMLPPPLPQNKSKMRKKWQSLSKQDSLDHRCGVGSGEEHQTRGKHRNRATSTTTTTAVEETFTPLSTPPSWFPPL